MSTNSLKVWALFLFWLMCPDQTDLSHGTGDDCSWNEVDDLLLEIARRMHCQDLMKQQCPSPNGYVTFRSLLHLITFSALLD